VRPFDIRAINNPIKGAHEICQAQKKMVFVPSHSLSEKGVSVSAIGITLVIYPPRVVTKLSAINKVGPTTITNKSSNPATIKLRLLNILIPLSRPRAAESINKNVTIIMITNCVQAEFG